MKHALLLLRNWVNSEAVPLLTAEAKIETIFVFNGSDMCREVIYAIIIIQMNPRTSSYLRRNIGSRGCGCTFRQSKI